MSDYYTLVTALPWLPELEQCKQLPLSRIALDQRLQMLSVEDREQLQLIERLYHPQTSELDRLTDIEMVSHCQKTLQQIRSQRMLQVINYQLELRTLVAAIRMRAAGVERGDNFYGYGRWLQRIRKHWFEADFSLEQVCPELKKIQRVLDKNNPLLLEQLLRQLLWRNLLIHERSEYFSFEAIACFVLRWTLAEQALKFDPEAAAGNFTDAIARLLRVSDLEQQLAQES